MKALDTRLLLASLLALAALAAQAQVSVDAAWVRGVVPGQTSTGAFMSIRSTEATELVDVSSPAAASAHIHRMAMDKGMMTMEPVDSVPVPENGTLELRPGSYHVMLVGLKRSLKTGDRLPLTLTFRDAAHKETSVTIEAAVRDITGSAK